MTTRLEIKGRVRNELNDLGPNFVWADYLVYQWLDEALDQLSLDLPTRQQITIPLAGAQRNYQLSTILGAAPVGPGGVVSLEFPPGNLMPRGNALQTNNGLVSESGAQPFANCWDVIELPGGAGYGGLEILFRYPPWTAANQYAYLLIETIYTHPTADVTLLTVANFDEPLLVWYICERALSWLAEQRGKRGAGSGRSAGPGYYSQRYELGVRARKKARGIRFREVQITG